VHTYPPTVVVVDETEVSHSTEKVDVHRIRIECSIQYLLELVVF